MFFKKLVKIGYKGFKLAKNMVKFAIVGLNMDKNTNFTKLKALTTRTYKFIGSHECLLLL